MTFLLNKYFFLQMTYELLLQSRKLDKLEGLGKNGGGGKFFKKKKKKSRGTLIRDPTVHLVCLNIPT